MCQKHKNINDSIYKMVHERCVGAKKETYFHTCDDYNEIMIK